MENLHFKPKFRKIIWKIYTTKSKHEKDLRGGVGWGSTLHMSDNRL